MLEDERQALSFDQVADFVRKFHGISSKQRIAPESQFERDLGITGDDGVSLLRAVEARFGVNLYREIFGLAPNEYLFNSEGFGLFEALSSKKTSVRAFTVGELYRAVITAQLQGSR